MGYWVHRFLTGDSHAYYKINMTRSEEEADQTRPESESGYDNVPEAEAGLSAMGIENGMTWYIHRIGQANDPARRYTINHSASHGSYNKTCPASPPGYPSIQQLADEGAISKLHADDSCHALMLEFDLMERKDTR